MFGFDAMFKCMFELYGDCLFLCVHIRRKLAEVVEDIEVVEQEYQVQENFEQDKLPSILKLCYYFQIHLYTMVLEKQLKPFHLCVKRYFSTLY